MPYGKPGEIEPVAEVGHKVLVIDRTQYKLYWVAYREQIMPSHPLVINLGAIAAGITLAPVSTAALLDLNDGQLGQFRAHVLDDFHAVIGQPQAAIRQSLANVIARLNAFARIEDPCDHLSEFFVLEDDRIFLTAMNPTQYALPQARVGFYGYKFVLAGRDGTTQMSGGQLPPIETYLTIDRAIASGERFTVVPVGGWTR